ncbi:MAG: hypothetical protein KBG28_08235 [Kofleriaceae bacterium]|nr:hypothetical protein [Kofleriaceae bacterium]
MRGTSLATWAALCLAVTLPRAGWAEDSLAAGAAAYAPHHTWGPTVRVGTTVGPVYGRRLDAQAVGGTVAAGQRLGRVTLEVELAYLAFQELGPSSLALGEALRLGGIVRADVLRVGSAWVGPNSMLALTTEVGAARQHDTWYPATANEVPRVVLDGGTHSEAHVGVGVMIDHRFERPRGIPNRVGWLLGWRLNGAPDAPTGYAVCRGVACAAGGTTPMRREYQTSLQFTSNLAFSW